MSLPLGRPARALSRLSSTWRLRRLFPCLNSNPTSLHTDVAKSDDGRYDTGIKVRNSLTKNLESLTTTTEGVLTWYQCGPTVYDSTHIGHACTYVRFDVIRRILEDHFGLVVMQAQGLTDVDDKIIKKAIENDESASAVSQKYEVEFAKDMAKLNVLPPSVQLKVTDHLPQIVEFIEEILNKSHAYVLPDGVYFDTNEFSKKHTYGKLQPKRQLHQNEENETNDKRGRKRAADFALWKMSKPNEVSWDSPWGAGRPGWHIECSAMASSIFGAKLDLHTGGQDLAFPHHENEMAQSESFHGCCQWGHVYLHAGHVLLKDVKISKSIGNVISIDQLLEWCTVDQFRLLVLMTNYRHSFNFETDVIDQAKKLSSRIDEFFRASDTFCQNRHPKQQYWQAEDLKLFDAIANTKACVDKSFRKDFDTETALKCLTDLVSDANRYMHNFESAENYPGSVGPILAVRKLLGRTLRTLGLSLPIWDPSKDKLWSCLANVDQGLRGGAASEELTQEIIILRKAVDELINFRHAVRVEARVAMKSNAKDLATALFAVCDDSRDKLGNLGDKTVIVRDSQQGSGWHIE